MSIQLFLPYLSIQIDLDEFHPGDGARTTVIDHLDLVAWFSYRLDHDGMVEQQVALDRHRDVVSLAEVHQLVDDRGRVLHTVLEVPGHAEGGAANASSCRRRYTLADHCRQRGYEKRHRAACSAVSADHIPVTAWNSDLSHSIVIKYNKKN